MEHHRGGGYGLYLSVYVFHNQGTGNYFNGAGDIKIGDAHSGKVYVQDQTIDCQDVTIGMRVSSIRHFGWPNSKYKAKGFEGRMAVTVLLDEQ